MTGRHELRHEPADVSGRPSGGLSGGLSATGRLLAWPFMAVIMLYRVTLSGLLGGHCRFWPSCSAYGLEAYREHGPVRGTVLTVWRVLRCQPFCKGGYDPVPLRRATGGQRHGVPGLGLGGDRAPCSHEACGCGRSTGGPGGAVA